ncbi:MAG: Spy/CpxP family protein refolding chaperone, partial [Bradyrhizobium sp.]|nr:Spy/CpxP family protein refolding chaperone [Bradyrhizobium sp.]
MSRYPARAVVTALSFLTFIPIASAQLPGHGMPHGGAPAMPHPAPAAPRMAAPAAPHFAPPAPHMAAPAPHMAAPAPRMAAPHFAAPAPHMATPRVAAPHVSAPPRNFAAHAAPLHAMPHSAAPPHGVPQIARGHAGPSPRFATGEARHGNIAAHAPPALNRHAATPPSGVDVNNHTAAGPNVNRAERQTTPRPAETVGQRPGGFRPGETVGVARSDRGTAEAARARVEESRKTPIIRSPVFAGQSPRSMRTNPSQWTFRGRFAQSAFAGAGRHHHHHLGLVLGFAGAVFWPYAYDDFVNYTFSPYAYDTFWPYAYDDVYAGIYGGYAPEYYAPQDAYAYAGSSASERAYARSERVASTSGTAPASSARERICSGEAQGLTDFSIQKIADQVQPTADQQRLLDDLKAATVKAVEVMQATCPAELPSTPTGRLTAMRTRVDAMLKAVQIVRPALDKFYGSLNDEQRERFNALDQGDQAQARTAGLDRLCSGQDSVQARLPVLRIQRALKLKPDQDSALQALDDATAKSAEILKGQCQAAETLTPTGRLAAME